MVFDATIKEYLKEIDGSPLLTFEKEQELGRRIVENNDPLAREQFVLSNLRLVVNIAKRYANRGMSLGDLIEEGNIGLIKAVDYFDPDRGVRFSTYAAWWIKQSIKRALLSNIQLMHVPTYMVSLINQWKHMASEVQNKLGRVPNPEEMADIMQMPICRARIIDHVVKLLDSVRDTASGGERDEDQELRMVIRDRSVSKPEDSLVADEEKAKAISFLSEITPREAVILKLHYGLGGESPMTMKEIGRRLGLTRERVRQIMRGSLTRLYDYMNE